MADKTRCSICNQEVYRINGKIGMHTRSAGGSQAKPLTELCPGSK